MWSKNFLRRTGMARLQSISGFLAALLVLILSSRAEAQTAAAISIPESKSEYENIFSVEPTRGELAFLQEKLTEYRSAQQGNRNTVKSRSDLTTLLSADSKPETLVLIGHNHEGSFRFPNGDSSQISELAQAIREADILPVFLTCNGQRHTESPAPRLKLTYEASLSLLSRIESATNEKPKSAIPLSAVPASGAGAPARGVNCRKIMSPKRASTVRRTSTTERQIRTTIRRAEIKGLLTSTPVKVILTALASGGLLAALDDD